MLEAAQRVDIELRKKAEREVERLISEVHHAQCGCHDGLFDCPDQPTARLDHKHPFTDTTCAAKRKAIMEKK